VAHRNSPGRVRPAGRADGQVIVVVMLFLIVLVGFAGLVVDVGRVYVAQRQLQQAADASALAASQDMPNTSLALSAARLYSAAPGQVNAHSGVASDMLVVNPTATQSGASFKCLTSVGVPCETDTSYCSSGAGCNAIKVVEQGKVDTWFLGVLGTRFTQVSATATAAMHGGPAQALDVAVILDSTTSMNSPCGNDVTGIATGQATKFDCAKEGVRALLQSLNPCSSSLASCGPVSAGNVAAPLDEVALFTFPGLLNPTGYTHDATSARSNLSLDFGCPGNLTGATTPSWYQTGSSSVGAGTDEVQKITYSGSGSFTLKFNGSAATTGTALKKTTVAATIQSALRALSTINGAYVTVSGSSSPWTVTFGDLLGNQNQPLITGSATSSTVSVAELTAGATYFPQWYLLGPTTGSAGDYGYTGATLSYQVVGLSSDYRPDASATGLLSDSSPLVQASSWATCSGAAWPGNPYYGLSGHVQTGAGTYLATAISAASSLLAADSARKAKPVIIVLSDGDADTSPTGTAGDPCHEAIQASQTAQSLGSSAWVYSIAYDATNLSSTCAQDGGTYAGLTDFTTMQQIASDPSRFYCLNPPSGQTCNSADETSLKAIFRDIGVDLTTARLVTDDAS